MIIPLKTRLNWHLQSVLWVPIALVVWIFILITALFINLIDAIGVKLGLWKAYIDEEEKIEFKL